MRTALLALLLAFLLGATEASAQTTPTFGEKAVGSTDCKNGAFAADFDTLAQCTSTSSSTGTMQKAPIFVGAVTSPPYPSTTCDSSKAGMMRYSDKTMQFCDGTRWHIVTTTSDPCAGTPTIGDACADGTVYAGITPDGSVPMYTTRCDMGQTWDGDACVGTRLTDIWAGNIDSLTAATSLTSGSSNTQVFVDIYNLGHPDRIFSGSPHAGMECADLDAHGHTDWYLPARNELAILRTNRLTIKNFDVSGSYYWSSTDSTAATAIAQRFSDGTQAARDKYDNWYLLRCVRK